MDSKVKNTILSTQKEYLTHEEVLNDMTEETKDIIISITQNILDNFFIDNFVSVQPLTAPVGMVFHLKSENEDGEIKIKAISNAIEARTLKLKTHLTLECVTNTKTFESSKDNRIFKTLANNILNELYYHIIGEIEKISTKKSFSLNNENIEDIQSEIIKESIDIAKKTRRGAANYIITNEYIFEKLFKDIISDDKIKISDTLTKMGVFNDIDVYVDKLMTKNKAIMGYKGKTEADAGFIFSPYVTLLSCGIVVDPETFLPKIPFMTRNGFFSVLDERKSISEDGTTTIIKEPSKYFTTLFFDFKEKDNNEKDNKEKKFNDAMNILKS